MNDDRWHVSPAVDLTAYAFSWVFVLVPLELLTSRTQQVALLLLVVGATFAHRHYALPYVYLDSQVFASHRTRFIWLPVLVGVGFLASPFLWNTQARIVVAAVVFAAGAWNVWHVYAQKFGILRMYAAKSGATSRRALDRVLLFCWVPLYLVDIGPTYRAQIEASFPTVQDLALPLVDAMARARGTWLVPAVACVVLGVGLWLAEEWRARRLANAPRLGMALGTTLLSASFLVANPVRVFMAFAFSHAVEYMVFVWAFQRRHYRRRLAHDPLLGRILERPVMAYGLFTLGLTAPYLLARFWGYLIVPTATNPTLFGTTVERWGFYYGVYQSLVHFYYDGFLWKMRSPALQADL